jgi:hypothetical protein
MHLSLASAIAAALVVSALPGHAAQAAMFGHHLRAPSAVEHVACRLVRERVVRPSGRVVYREREQCGEPFAMIVDDADCVIRRERIVRPNGTVVYRRVRRCD